MEHETPRTDRESQLDEEVAALRKERQRLLDELARVLAAEERRAI